MELLQPSISRSGHLRVTVCAEGNSPGSHGTCVSLLTLAMTRTEPRRVSGRASSGAASDLWEAAATRIAPKVSKFKCRGCCLHSFRVRLTRPALGGVPDQVCTAASHPGGLGTTFRCVSHRGAEESLRAQRKLVVVAGGLGDGSRQQHKSKCSLQDSSDTAAACTEAALLTASLTCSRGR